MAYAVNEWNKGDVITSAKLNNIEKGIAGISEATDTIKEEVVKTNEALTNVTEKVAGVDNNIASIKETVNSIAGMITGFPDRIAALEDTVRELKKTNIVEVSNPAAQFANTDADAEIGAVTIPAGKAAGISAKTISLKGSKAESAAISLKAVGAVTMNDVTSTGTLATSVSNAAWSINTNDEVVIRNCDLQQAGYNSVEIGLGNTAPKTVLIENCQFGNLSNNAINVFATADNATVTVRDCTMGDLSQLIRISNRNNAKNVTFNLINIDIKSIDKAVNGQFILCQDYTSKSSAEGDTNNLFDPAKITFNLTNVTIAGKKVESAENIVMLYRDKTPGGYVSNKKTELFPTVIVK